MIHLIFFCKSITLEFGGFIKKLYLYPIKKTAGAPINIYD